MNHKVVIRNETAADIDAIRDVTVAAFKTLDISSHTEQFIIAALRAAKSLAVSLVAEADGRVAGHIAFSPVSIRTGPGTGTGLDLCRSCRHISGRVSARRWSKQVCRG